MKKVLIVSAHPDDETLGCGGTILKHAAAGDELAWLIITTVHTSHGFSEARVTSRQAEIEEVRRAFGFHHVYSLDYPTMHLDSTTLIGMVPRVSAIFTEFEPEVIYVLNRSDAHSDHRVVFDAVLACTKSFRYPFVKQVLMYECISETEFAPALPEKVFMPTYFVDVSAYHARKLEIMKIYDSELGEHPFPRSLRNMEALATYRGAMVGVEYAEAFQLLKYIDK